MIRIGKPIIKNNSTHTRLSVDVVKDETHHILWVEVENRFSHGLCADRVDAFLVGLLGYAIKNKHDIYCEAPLTNLLKDQIDKDFIDVVCQHQPELHRVKISAPLLPPIFKNKIVRGMGLSCGVDCLYTVHNRMLDESLGERYFLMTDAHLRSVKDTDVDASRRFNPLFENGKEFAQKMGIPLVVIKTNWGPSLFSDMAITNSTTYCNCFVALSLQNLFTHYYLASGGPIRDFSVRYLKNGLFRTDCSNYDLLSLPAYSTPSLRFVVDGLEERVKKVRTLLEWSECWDNLDVCEMHRQKVRGNDTFDCHKCMHTVNEILSQGGIEGLEKFSRVFDVDYVKKHRAEYLAYLICQRIERSEIGMEAWKGRAREGCSLFDYLKAFWIIGRKAVQKKFSKKNRTMPTKWIDI